MAAPKNPKAYKGEKIWREAINRAVCRVFKDKDGRTRTLDKLADALVRSAMEGDVSALKELGDRLDGKPTQMVGGDKDNPIELSLRVNFVAPKVE